MTNSYIISLLQFIIIFFPQQLKRYVMNHCFNWEIDKSAYVGFSLIKVGFVKLGPQAKISSFNIIIHLDKLVLGETSTINRGNWITGFPTGTSSPHFKHDGNRKCELIIGNESAITKEHHIDCTNAIHIGNYVTIGGCKSQLLTHSIDIYENRQDSHPIDIGDYCFISTGVIILGGSKLPSYSILGAGAMLNKSYTSEWKLYAGVPAKPLKDIPHNAKYFSREKGFVF